MLVQRLVIRLLPLEVLFVGSVILGWTIFQLDPVSALHLEAAAPDLAAEASAPASAPGNHPPAALAPVFTPEVQRWAAELTAWAGAVGLDPNLAATVMQIESCGWRGAVSRSGAQGLFQVMPFHFTAGEDMQDPATNAQRGLAYLALGLERAGGDVGRALAGYNGGHSQIGKDPALWPTQTQRYWYWGTGIYADASSGQASSPRLQEWLQAGGASLCAQAAQASGPQ